MAVLVTFTDDDGNRWEAVYDPETRRHTYTALGRDPARR